MTKQTQDAKWQSITSKKSVSPTKTRPRPENRSISPKKTDVCQKKKVIRVIQALIAFLKMFEICP
jgi:hypothetical protein